ncbi:DsbA family protein [Natronolimnohabitans innermongolicus]|uniref:Disulfide bond formation protein n=1 Tax=Natronolimnohabitans innermongolicus JCM 12255 TaxID=1227499 RepID=L9XLS9_9EURY|nr:thioredoxin domain-containing protein [Natronolimnohabitans innermongolicus]ELY61613.1 disulfide bond formation protein [Natronolimnohabitans innermongolicus JCM 12255]
MRYTRRAVLGTAAVAGLGTVAGCLGSGDPPEAPVAGDPDADVTVTVYEDFSCPYCRDFKLDIVPQLEEAYLEPETIRYEHRNFPVPVDNWSLPVANAARDVFEESGSDDFWTFTTEIYEHLDAYSYDVIEQVADDVGADGSAVREAAEDEAHESTIEDDRSYAESEGVEGTPTVFVDGEQVTLQELSFEQVAAPIEDALE